MYAEKVVALYDPHSNPVWGRGSSPPQHSQKLASMVMAHTKFCWRTKTKFDLPYRLLPRHTHSVT